MTPPRWFPAVITIVVLAFTVLLAWNDKDVVSILLIYFLLKPAFFILCAGLSIWAIIELKSPRGRSILQALVLIVILTPITFFGIRATKDYIRFYAWYLSQGELVAQYAGKDAILLEWEGGGMAGMENDSYVVSSSNDRLDEPDERLKWLRNIGSDCEIMDTKRLARGFYLATTYECPLPSPQQRPSHTDR